MSVQKRGVTQHTLVSFVFLACDAKKTRKTRVCPSLCGVFVTRPPAGLPEKATPPWGDMAAAGTTESGAVTLDSNYMIAQKTLLLTNCYTKSCIGLYKVGVGCDRGR